MLPYVCCSQGLVGTGLPSVFLFTVVFQSAIETISPGLAVPEASTTSLVLPGEDQMRTQLVPKFFGAGY